MDWTATYQNASDRHRERARAARAAHLMYVAALHERAAEILDAEVAWGQPSASAPAPAPSYSTGRGWSMTGPRPQSTS
ncbi:MAG TPA: hypothetical protein VFP66_09345 [Candidatus Limnocylindrales bacterium]|nr:hypothetical protein [Candidatus Limnocylindrales bacterium]